MNFLYRLKCFIFSERCPYCKAVIEAGEIACSDCIKKMESVRKPIIGGAQGFRCVSSFVYAGRAKKMICDIKFRDRTQFIPQAAEILARDIRNVYGDYGFDLLTAVPMHPKDERIRGYNQSELLAKDLSKLLGLPYAVLLNKVKRTKKQHRLKYSERKRNLNGAFEITDRELIKGKRILIVDDIVTSGYTLGTCCRTINRAKPELLCCTTLANARTVVDEKAIF